VVDYGNRQESIKERPGGPLFSQRSKVEFQQYRQTYLSADRARAGGIRKGKKDLSDEEIGRQGQLDGKFFQGRRQD